jgi:hypothetical protein
MQPDQEVISGRRDSAPFWAPSANITQAVPFFGVTNMEASLGYYVDGLGFEMKNSWIPDRAADKPDGRIRWCCLARDGVAIMFQEFLPEYRPKEKLGSGASVLSVQRRARALPRIQITRHRNTHTPICRQQYVGRAAYRSRRLSHRI